MTGRNRSAFTLIELLVVIAIIAILIRALPAPGGGAIVAEPIIDILRCTSDGGALHDNGVYERFPPGQGGWPSGLYNGVTSYGANARSTTANPPNGVIFLPPTGFKPI